MSIGKSSITRAEKAGKGTSTSSFVTSVQNNATETMAAPQNNGKFSLEYVDVNLISEGYDKDSFMVKKACENIVRSVREYGILVPLLLRKAESGYKVISGHKRLYAAKNLGLKAVPAQVIECSDSEAAELFRALDNYAESSYRMGSDFSQEKASKLPEYLL